MKFCEECGRAFEPRADHFEHTCGKPSCQRARKSRLQRQRRVEDRRETVQTTALALRAKSGAMTILQDGEDATTTEQIATRKPETVVLELGPGLRVSMVSRVLGADRFPVVRVETCK